MTNASNLPAPYGGVDETVPLASLQHPFCENLFNFNPVANGIALRPGDSGYSATTGIAGTFFPRELAAYGNTSLWAVIYNSTTTTIQFFNIDVGGTAHTSAAGGDAQDWATLIFNNYLFFFTTTAAYDPGFYYDGAAWGAIGYTGTGTFLPFGGNVYKNRAYLIQSAECAYWYSELEAVTGATTKVDLSSVVSEKSTLAIIASIVIADNVQSEQFQAFIMFSGEVLFYSGSYPDSQSWGLVGQANISSPLNYNSGVQYGGDYFIFCEDGVVSLRTLFLQGSESAQLLNQNRRIHQTWVDTIKALRAWASQLYGAITGVKGVWDRVNGRIYIRIPGYINSVGTFTAGNFYFVFDGQFQAWYYHRTFGLTTQTGLVSYRNKILYFTAANTAGAGTAYVRTYIKEGATNYTDVNTLGNATAYDYEFISAPIPFPKTQCYETTQIEPIIESDLYAQTNWYLVADFGRQTTNAQTTDAATTAPAKPAVNVGIQNATFVQVKMSGTTTTSKTVGLKLYSYNVWYNMGEVASR